MHKIGKTFIVSGPSGVGKSTVLHALFQGRDDLYFSVSATTRAPREGEQDGVDYHFIQADAFRGRRRCVFSSPRPAGMNWSAA